MWRNKTLLTVGACAGVAVALYYAIRKIPKFLYNEDELNSGKQAPVSGQSSVMERSLDVMDTEATPPSLSLKDTEAPPPSLVLKDTEAPPPSLGLMGTEAPPPTLGLMAADPTLLSGKVMDNEDTPPSPGWKDTEATPVIPTSVGMTDTEATPPSLGLMSAGAPPPSLGLKDTEAPPPSLGLMGAEAPPPSLGDGVMDNEDTPSYGRKDTEATPVIPPSVGRTDTEATPPSKKVVTPTTQKLMPTDVTPSSPVNLPGVLSELVDDFTELHKHYEVHETIGSGEFGTVKLGIHLLTGEKVAIKIMEKKDVSDDLWREIDAMMNLHHQHVCRLYHVIETPNRIYLVLEYCPGGALFDLIVEKERFSEVEARRYFRQIVSALAYVHSQGYAHRDLKPENLLLDDHNNIKLIDFGLCAKPEGGLGSPLTTFCGSLPYTAPELHQGKAYNGSKADIWSLGVVLFTMLCGYLPFYNQNKTKLSRQVVRGQFKKPDWLSCRSLLLLKQMLQVDPKRRVTVEQLLNHPWLMNGYSSPVDWHSTRPHQHLDQDCISEMAVLLNQPELNTIQLVSEWKYDQTTATYLLLLARKQLLSAACIPSGATA